MASGTVKSFNLTRHFGFIRPDMGGKDIFVHISEVQRSGHSCLRKGQKLSFEIVNEQGRMSARNLKIDGQRMNADNFFVDDPRRDEAKNAAEQRRPAPRQTVTRDALQFVIAEAIRTTGSQCDAFVGVWLEKRTPKSRDDANWKVKGIKYGKSDRAACDAALSDIVERLQQEFVILDEPE